MMNQIVPAPVRYRHRFSGDEALVEAVHGRPTLALIETVDRMFHEYRMDTKDIAVSLMLPEATIYGALARCREARHAAKVNGCA